MAIQTSEDMHRTSLTETCCSVLSDKMFCICISCFLKIMTLGNRTAAFQCSMSSSCPLWCFSCLSACVGGSRTFRNEQLLPSIFPITCALGFKNHLVSSKLSHQSVSKGYSKDIRVPTCSLLGPLSDQITIRIQKESTLVIMFANKSLIV